MTRASRRGPWLPEEDGALIELVRTQGPNNWVRISQQLQHRSPKQCRERYHQNLKPSLNHEPISVQEGEVIEQLVDEMGKRWAEIARRLGNRSDNAVKNWWNGSMNRRKRIPPQNNHLKHIGNCPRPMSSTKLQRPYCSLPAGVTTRQSEVLPDSLNNHKRWSAPESSSAEQRTLQLPTPRLQSNSESNILFSRPVQKAPIGSQYDHYQGDQKRQQSPHHTDLKLPGLPLLRLPSLSHHMTDFNHTWDKPLLSPAISEFSRTLSARPPPSLISDTQSNFSISPKTVVSPPPNASHPPNTPNTDAANSTWKKDNHAQPYEPQGLRGQMALSPPYLELPSVSSSSRLSETRRDEYPSIYHLSRGSCNSYDALYVPRNESLRDSRMHVSSLVQ